MRTPTMVYENSLNIAATQNLNDIQQQRHMPIILNKSVKRKAMDDVGCSMAQPQTKILRRTVNNAPQIYYSSESIPTSQMLSHYTDATSMMSSDVDCITSSSHHHHHINNSNSNSANSNISNNNNNNSHSINNNNNCLMSATTTQSHNIEYVMFDNNLLPVQHNTIISEPNPISLSDINTTWTNSDLLDLDHKDHLNRMNSTDYDNGNGLHSEDLEDKNLSWLFNFKLDELPHLSPEVKSRTSRSNVTTSSSSSQQNNTISVSKKILLDTDNYASSAEVDDLNIGENVVIENVTTTQAPKKPPFTYTELIEYALEDRGELTVSGIYQWISDRFTFYKSNDDRWKNSVRHNLSINPHFRKGSKAPQGAGHLWTISTRDSETNMLAWEHKKQRLELFLKMEAANTNAKKQQQYQTSSNMDASPTGTNQNGNNSSYDETAAAVGSITFIGEKSSDTPDMSIQHGDENCSHNETNHSNYTSSVPTTHQSLHHNSQATTTTIDHDHELRRTAGEILNGVRRNVEVQILNPPSNYSNYHAFTLLESGDYLNPISKDEIAQECGLKSIVRNEHGNDFYITEIDPIELGIHMNSNDQDEVLFGDEFNFTYLGIGNGSNIMA